MIITVKDLQDQLPNLTLVQTDTEVQEILKLIDQSLFIGILGSLFVTIVDNEYSQVFGCIGSPDLHEPVIRLV